MLKYGVFVYSVLFLVDSIIQGLYENMISSSIVFGLAVIYLFVNLIRDTDDFIVLTPFVTFFSTFLNALLVRGGFRLLVLLHNHKSRFSEMVYEVM